MRRKWKTRAIAAFALVVSFCAGCNRQEPLYPVTGRIFVDGQPAAGALVVLHPVDDSDPAAIRPSGYVADDGTVRLTSYLTAARSVGDGAPAGEYIVTVSWLPADVKAHLAKHPGKPLPDRLEGRFGQPDKSKLRAKVLSQPTELPRFDLSKESAAATNISGPGRTDS